MKMPSSSSLLFATLAISSSSSSLAAPASASDAPQSEGGMTSSTSNHHMAARRGSTTTRGLRPADMEVRADTSAKVSKTDEIEARDGIAGIGTLLKGIVDPDSPLKPIFDALGLSSVAAASVESLVSEDDLVRFQNAISMASEAIMEYQPNNTQSLPVLGSNPVATPATLPELPQAPLAAKEVDPEADTLSSGPLASSTIDTGSSSATPIIAAAEDTSSAPSTGPGNPAAPMLPMTPALPVNPPNTPAIPPMLANATVPISLPDAAPVPRDLPITPQVPPPVSVPAVPATLPIGDPPTVTGTVPPFTKVPIKAAEVEGSSM